MRLYQRILAYGLMTAFGVGIFGCAQNSQDSNQNKPVEPRYISGTLKSEKYQKKLFNSDIHSFALSTEDGLKLFECTGDADAQAMDTLLNPKDEVTFKIPNYQRARKNNFCICLANSVIDY